ISATQSSFLISFSIFGLIAGLFILEFFSDRYGRNSIIYFSLLCSVITIILIPISDSFYLIFFLRLIYGFTIVGLSSTVLSYVFYDFFQTDMAVIRLFIFLYLVQLSL